MGRTFLVPATTAAAVLLALMPLLAPAGARETAGEQTVVQTQETTATVSQTGEQTNAVAQTVQTQDTTTQNQEVTDQEATNGAAETDSENQNPPSDDARQQAQATNTADDGTQTAARAAGPLANEAARITVSNAKNPTFRIVVPAADCTVQETATLQVEDEDGTLAAFTDNNVAGGRPNAIISSSGAQVVARTLGGRGPAVIANRDDGSFGPEGTTDNPEIGTVVGSTGITCGDNNENEEGNGNDNDGETGDGGGTNDVNSATGNEQGDRSCAGAKEVENIDPTTTDTERQFRITGETFRVAYDVNILEPDDFPFVTLDISGRFGEGPLLIIDENDADRFISTAGPGNFDLTVNIDPPNAAEYEVLVEDCTGVAADNNDDIVNVPDDDLPNTGGVPLSLLAGCVALLLVGTTLVGIVTRRR